MACAHETRRRVWVEQVGEPGDYEFVDSHWETVVDSHCVDLDTHRYKCTKCGEVMWYSQAAKEGRI